MCQVVLILAVIRHYKLWQSLRTGPGLVRLIDETGLVFPTQGFGLDPQRDSGACICLISVLVGLGPGLELGAVQLFSMCELHTFPRRAVGSVAHVRLLT